MPSFSDQNIAKIFLSHQVDGSGCSDRFSGDESESDTDSMPNIKLTPNEQGSFDAAKAGNIEEIRPLVQDLHVNLHEKNLNVETAMAIAAAAGQIDTTAKLKDWGTSD